MKLKSAFIVLLTVLLYANTAQAGRVNGIYNEAEPSDKQLDYQYFGTKVLPKSSGFLWNADSKSGTYNTCTATLIRKNWLLTAAHCVRNKEGSFKFVSPQATASVNLAVIHPLYTGLNSIECFASPCKNANAGSNYDLALLRLDKDLTLLGMKVKTPSKQFKTKGFIGTLAGWGRRGDGCYLGYTSLDSTLSTNPIQPDPGCNLSRSKGKTPVNITDTIPVQKITDDKTLIILTPSAKLGGKNYILPIGGGRLFSSDFDGPSSVYDIDRQSALPLEFSPDAGDSGGALLDESGRLVGVVSAVGWGNRINTVSGLFTTYEPSRYGSLSFYTPVANLANWIAGAIIANEGRPPFSKGFTPLSLKLTSASASKGFLAGDGKPIPSSIFTKGYELIVNDYASVIYDGIYEKVFGSQSDSGDGDGILISNHSLSIEN